MHRPFHRSCFSFLVFALLSCGSGCTVIGLGLGAVIDYHAQPPGKPDIAWLRGMSGRSLRVTLRDGSDVRGKLARVACERESLLVFQPTSTGSSIFEERPTGDSLRVPVAQVVQAASVEPSRSLAFALVGSMADIAIGLAILNHQSFPLHPARPSE